jgi:hypothetical protein
VRQLICTVLLPSCVYLQAQVCDALTRAEQPLCPRCLAQPQLAVAVLQSRVAGLDTAYARLVQVLLLPGQQNFATSAP